MRAHLDPLFAFAAGRLYRALIDPLLFDLRRAVRAVTATAPDARILDVGCGTGAQLKLLAGEHRMLVGLDISRPMLTQARQVAGEVAALCVGDGAQLPFANETFDRVVLSMVLHAGPSATRAGMIGEARRVLRPDGTLVVVDYLVEGARAAGKPLARLLVRGVERAAGKDHFNAYRDFIASRGLEPLLQGAGLSLQRVIPWGEGVIGIHLCEVSALMTVAPAREADLEQLCQAARSAFEYDSTLKPQGAFRGGPPGHDSKEQHRRWLEQDDYYACTVCGALAGGCVVKRHPDHLELHAVFLHQDVLGRGIGTRFLREVLSRYPVDARWRLETPDYATRNHRLYQRLGFDLCTQSPADPALGFGFFSFER